MSAQQGPGDPTPPDAAGTRLLVAAANFAGQGRAWADAAGSIPDISATSFAVEDPTGLTLPAHHFVGKEQFADPQWAATHEEWVRSFTHVLIEAGRPVTGLVHGLDAYGDADVLGAAGVRVGMVAHGSDVRRPDRHEAIEPDSPFPRVSARIRATRQKYADRIAPLMDAAQWSFVSTPDLVDDVPRARWLPVVVDVERWSGDEIGARDRGVAPVVSHIPSNAMWKGTELVEPVLEELAAAGHIQYRPVRGVPQPEMPAAIAASEIVLDQFALGSYGVAAVEAMAAGRVVVGHVRPEVRARVLAATGLELPVVQARAAEVADVLRDLIDDPARCREVGEAGAVFARAVHDGRASALVLEGYLHGPEVRVGSRADQHTP
ncbi:hypothetical protein JNB_18538 [Janibacter sp. HTCC2649]|uniref:glycosyltransferase family 1 protein n=1 Tax=Janibacter sp. HTCC2649 TaxID=313589 RepID=UPI0000670F71|nr:glycosyltransferase family 1 protein [Janibacter sp. HTCC2649]EAP97496.1 hypothetical protein JNB_18538 [Janibacter sp. HTCC2649]